MVSPLNLFAIVALASTAVDSARQTGFISSAMGVQRHQATGLSYATRPNFCSPFRGRSAVSMVADFKVGLTIEMDGQVWKVLEFLHVKPGKGAAFVRTKLKNLVMGQTVEKTFRGSDNIVLANVEKTEMQYNYDEGDSLVFMNMESFETEAVLKKDIDNIAYLKEGTDVNIIKWGDMVLDVELPKTMVLEVAETAPGERGNTVQGGVKPATTETGAVVNVPLFVNVGDKIKVEVSSNSYLGREK